MKSRLEWKVGLFVFIGLVLLAALLVEFSKGMTFFSPTYRILLNSPSVGGLKVRAAVLMSGVQVGTVSDIQLAPDGKSVTLVLRIYSKYVIHRDARFLIEQSGFLGDQYVAIIPTTNQAEPFKDGDNAQAEPPFNMQEVARSASGFIIRVDESLKQLNEIVADLRRLVLNQETLTNFSMTVANLRNVSDKAQTTVDRLNSVLAANSPSVSRSVSNLVTFSEQINRFASDLEGLLATNSPDIRAAVKNVESSTAALKTILANVQTGKGPAATLVNNQQMATDLEQVARNLSITTSNLNRLGLWGILWSRKPPKTEPPPSAERPLSSPKNTVK